mgnify:FL=1
MSSTPFLLRVSVRGRVFFMCLKDLRDEFLYYVTVRHRDALSKQLMKYRTLRDAYLKEYPSRHKNLFLSKNGKPLTDEAVARMLKH